MSDESKNDYTKKRAKAEAYTHKAEGFNLLTYVKLWRHAEVAALYVGIFEQAVLDEYHKYAGECREKWVSACQNAIDSDELTIEG